MKQDKRGDSKEDVIERILEVAGREPWKVASCIQSNLTPALMRVRKLSYEHASELTAAVIQSVVKEVDDNTSPEKMRSILQTRLDLGE